MFINVNLAFVYIRLYIFMYRLVIYLCVYNRIQSVFDSILFFKLKMTLCVTVTMVTHVLVCVQYLGTCDPIFPIHVVAILYL